MAASPDDTVALTLAHYREKFAVHGSTPQGVDWNGAESQRLQFEQLLKLLPDEGGDFSLNDFGCGYGALADLLLDRRPQIRYRGYDINPDMIAAAIDRHRGQAGVGFHVADRPLEEADYGVASGVFTLRLGRSDAQCRADLLLSLDALDATSRRGFGFNCLTAYSDADRMKDYLYYPDPRDLFDVCKRRYARNVALLHDYGLFAFTVLVRKQLPGVP